MAYASLRSMTSGAVGALTLTAIHEAARRRLAYAPRMDVVGMRALRQLVPALRHEPPRSSRLHRLALAGDLLANTLYYSAIPARDAATTWTRAALLGLAAGAGAVLVPARAGLGNPPNSEMRANQAMTIAWYVAGALAAAVAANKMGYGRLPR
jgi:hypothetical protein